jgi:hypothetical protein
MAVAFAPNNTFDLYHNAGTPPASPDIAAVPCFLRPDFAAGQERGERGELNLTWTHVALVDATLDIRDRYAGGSTVGAVQDIVYVPDQNGTPFYVIFIEMVNKGTANVVKRVYLDRRAPTWPTNNL